MRTTQGVQFSAGCRITGLSPAQNMQVAQAMHQHVLDIVAEDEKRGEHSYLAKSTDPDKEALEWAIDRFRLNVGRAYKTTPDIDSMPMRKMLKTLSESIDKIKWRTSALWAYDPKDKTRRQTAREFLHLVIGHKTDLTDRSSAATDEINRTLAENGWRDKNKDRFTKGALKVWMPIQLEFTKNKGMHQLMQENIFVMPERKTGDVYLVNGEEAFRLRCIEKSMPKLKKMAKRLDITPRELISALNLKVSMMTGEPKIIEWLRLPKSGGSSGDTLVGAAQPKRYL